MQGFKKFLLQGNVVELAVAVIIAGAFGKVVDAVVKFLMDIIALIGGAPSFDSLSLGFG
jgi:large conductance mechanosensitive channel